MRVVSKSIAITAALCGALVHGQVPSVEVPAAVASEHAQEVIGNAGASSCDRACALIQKSHPDLVYLGTKGTFDFWDTKQHNDVPACRVEPSTPQEVSEVLKIAVQEQCHFAVKGGGHSRIAESSNAKGGITVDLVKFKSVTIAKDRKSVEIGGGALWLDVYEALEKEGLVVVGGRVHDVGVGGLTLGGGISFFSGRHGWACDNVISYSIVLPDGTPTTVTQKSHPDLYWALRGGSNNFGIVTSFTFTAFEHRPELWRGINYYSWDKVPALLDAQYKFQTELQPKDLDSAAFFPFAYVQEYDMFMSLQYFISTSHTDAETWPAAFKSFEEIERIPNGTILAFKPQSEIVKENGPTSTKQRTVYKTITYRPSAELDQKVLDIFMEEIEPIKKNPGTLPVVIFHPISPGALAHMSDAGGNALGLSEKDGPLTIMQCSWEWTSESEDAINLKHINQWFDRSKAAAEEMGLLHPYIYQNYAWGDQDVFPGYGEKSLKRLQKVQKEVDPEGIFQASGLCGGYFKVNTKGVADKAAPAERGHVRDEL